MARPATEPLTVMQTFAFNPLVKPSQIPEFEAFAQQIYREYGYPESAGVDPGFGFGIFANDANRTRFHATSGLGSNYNASYELAAPIFQFNNADTSVVLFDLHSTSSVGPWIENLLDCSSNEKDSLSTETAATGEKPTQWDDENPGGRNTHKYQVPKCMFSTSNHVTMMRQEPSINIGTPISPANNPDTLVGLITTTIHWTSALTGITPGMFQCQGWYREH